MMHSSAVSPPPLRLLLCNATVDGDSCGLGCESKFHFLRMRLKIFEVVNEDVSSTVAVYVALRATVKPQFPNMIAVIRCAGRRRQAVGIRQLVKGR